MPILSQTLIIDFYLINQFYIRYQFLTLKDYKKLPLTNTHLSMRKHRIFKNA